MNTKKYTERSSNEKGLRENKQCKAVYHNDEQLAKPGGRSSGDGIGLW